MKYWEANSDTFISKFDHNLTLETSILSQIYFLQFDQAVDYPGNIFPEEYYKWFYCINIIRIHISTICDLKYKWIEESFKNYSKNGLNNIITICICNNVVNVYSI